MKYDSNHPALNPTPALPLSGEGAKACSSVGSKSCSAPPPAKGEAGRGLHNPKPQKSQRRQLRKNQTEPEKRFWSWVRGKQLGVKFRRQQGIGKYIVDFYSAEYALIIEIDGDSHYTPEAIVYDGVRTDFLNSKGFRVIRFTNQDVMENKEGVLMKVIASIDEQKKIAGVLSKSDKEIEILQYKVDGLKKEKKH